MPPKLQTLAEQLIQQLEHEYESLCQSRSTLEQLHDTLVHGSLSQLEEQLQLSQVQAQKVLAIREDRKKISSEIAACFDIPVESLKLSEVISRLPEPFSHKVSEYRDRLSPLALEVEQWTHRCAHLVTHCQKAIQKAFSEMTEGGTPVFRYGPGSRQEAARGTLLVTEG